MQKHLSTWFPIFTLHGKLLDYFTQWKMMGFLGLCSGTEPGNCHPCGRDVMRKEGGVKFLQPGKALPTRRRLAFMK